MLTFDKTHHHVNWMLKTTHVEKHEMYKNTLMYTDTQKQGMNGEM